MSEKRLRDAASRVMQEIHRREIPGGIEELQVVDSGTDGWRTELVDFDGGSISLWLDRYTGEQRFYYGFVSSSEDSVRRVRAKLSSSSKVIDLREMEYHKVGEYFQYTPDAVARMWDRSFVFEKYPGEPDYYFGRYVFEKDGDVIVLEALEFIFFIIFEVQPQAFYEGQEQQITKSYRERDPAARAACIRHHGYKCKVCSIDFGEFYGETGSGFIHVHHIVPLGAGERLTNPVDDLVPVCPNCHAMLHRKEPPLKPEDLRGILEERGRLQAL